MVISSENIYNSLMFFYYILKLLGLAPYRFDKKTQTFQMKLLNYFQLIFFLILFAGLAYIEIKNINNNRISAGVQSVFLEDFWRYTFAFQQVLASPVIIFCFLKRKTVENMVNTFQHFDEHLKYLGDSSCQVIQQSPLITLGIVVLSALVMAAYCVLRITLDSSGYVYDFAAVFRFVAYFLINMFYLLISLQFILSVHFVNVRLTTLIKVSRYVPKT